MSEEQKTIDACWPIARAIGLHMQEWHNGRGGSDCKWFHESHWDGNSYIAAVFSEPGEIVYRLNKGADVHLLNLTIPNVKPGDINIGPIEAAGAQRTVRTDVMSTRNHSDTDVERELTYRDLESTTVAENVANEVGASIAMGLRQQVGYGSEIYGIEGETEITLNIEASFRRAWENSSSRSVEHEVESTRTIIEKARHKTVIERVEQIGPARQTITARGKLAFGCKIHSSGHWWNAWDSMNDFVAVLQGVESKSPDPHNWLGFYREHPVPRSKLEVFKQDVYATVEKIREFEEVKNISVDIRSDPL